MSGADLKAGIAGLIPLASRTVRVAAAVLVAAMAALAPASAQISDDIDSSLLENWRLPSGDTIRYCQYAASPTAAFDRAVGEAISERLLLGSQFVELGSAYGIGAEFAAEDLYIALTNECDVALGMGIASGLYPVEFTVTRPYVGFSYMLVVADPAFGGLMDIPTDRRLGTMVGSYGNVVLGRYIASRPGFEGWQRLPYGDIDLMLTRLLDGTIAGMVVYGPTFSALTERRPEAADLKVISLDDLFSTTVNTGGVMLARNAFLRITLDQAIEEMIADGTIAALLEDAGLDGVPAAPGGL